MPMDNALSRLGFLKPRFSDLTKHHQSLLLLRGFSLHGSHGVARRSLCVSVFRSSLQGETTEWDLISKASDMLWGRKDLKLDALETSIVEEDSKQSNDAMESEADSGFLKLTTTRDWIAGDSSAPLNRKLAAELKSELLLLTTGIGAACSLYCLLNFSFEAAVSYASGVLFSCLYLQLLYYHTDNLSKEAIPTIFLQKKSKNKIGIRSEDLKNVVEKTMSGTTIALSSPRLVIPASIYGLWALSRHFNNDFFDFQIVPGMMGFFAYKAAALVQVYRDNENLHMIFPENEGTENT
uniref:Uncharacterized protein n=1 Tax=Ananas comosus var. bracteatus TaxID=296719 RepID=A0A6V7PR54_ANACO|nr:unnamed protein product [Ananas comosus var. bracteatus]